MSVLFPLLLLIKLKEHGRHGVRLPPGPWRLPVIGSLHRLIGKPLVHRALADLSRSLDAPLMYLKLGEVPGEKVNVSKRIATVIADAAVRAMIGDRFERREEFLEAVEELNKLASAFSLGDLFPSSWFVNFISGITRRAHANRLKRV
ncbi:hypothetical protein BAE44_0010057 [Dichanthelium oligosanthes]|uniref:Uncharacterized protein n=1 Tax=Dichanthelium oligosanthes TaxID=888268 RepID=A0A1E5VUX9_9POAL|nr:hypothetical protein BAE44_0010057 [Dichanthelium oligosanthes]